MNTDNHYLKKELYELVATDISIFEFIQKGALDGIWYWDLEVPENEWMSPDFWTTLGYEPNKKKHLASEWQKLIFQSDLNKAIDNLHKHCKNPDHPYDQVVRYRHRDGSVVWIRCRGIAVRNEEGIPVRMLGAHTDLTKQKQAEHLLQKANEDLENKVSKRTSELIRANERLKKELNARTALEDELRESEEKYRSMMDALQDAAYICSSDYRVEYMNPAMISIVGSDVTGQHCYKAIHGQNKICPWCVHHKVLENKTVETKIISPRNQHHYFVSNSPIVHKDGTISKMTVYRDTTHLVKLENQLRQAQKMEAIGRLAGGVAHDFNNILTTIIGTADLMLIGQHISPPVRDGIEEIKAAGMRAADLTRQLLAFSRKQVIQPAVLDLNALLEGLKKMLARLIGEDIETRFIPEENLWMVNVDAGQLEQVVMNLAVNARDAMPSGGKLTIKTHNVNLDEAYRTDHGIDAPEGPYVMFSVSDTGTGMSKETQEHIFEPFFTTKENNKGTGLGLASVYGIVKQNNGIIMLYSEPGQGTTFHIYLPRFCGEAEKEEKVTIPANRLSGSETILIVEDDICLRKVIISILDQYGYATFEAEDGLQALQLCTEPDRTLDLMITDVVMPQMNGKESADQIVSLHPNLKVLFISGYTDNAIVHHGVLSKGLNFLEKPFTPERLLKKVRNVLDQQRIWSG
ncbi:MAG: response regulator [Desulfobacterales bacterium]|nr:response regulator [Desulfobacterales bacterium]